MVRERNADARRENPDLIGCFSMTHDRLVPGDPHLPKIGQIHKRRRSLFTLKFQIRIFDQLVASAVIRTLLLCFCQSS
jgi:hypothetical protein